MENKEKNPLIYLFQNITWPKTLILSSIFISTISSIGSIIIPYMTGKTVDFIGKDNLDYRLIVVFCLVFLVSALLNGYSFFLLSKIGEKLILEIRSFIWNHIIFMKMNFFDREDSGELMSRITDDTSVINEFLSQKIPNIIPSLFTVLGSSIMLFVLDWKLTLLILLVIPISLIIIIPLGNISQVNSEKTQKHIADFSGALNRILTEIRLVKIASTEDEELIFSKNILNKRYTLKIKQAKIDAIIQPLLSIITLLMVSVVLGYGGIRISNGTITAGVLVSIIFYIFQMTSPLINILSTVTEYKTTLGASKRIYNLLSLPKEDFYSLKDTVFDDGDIEFKSVTFKYDTNTVLDNISFSAKKGKITAFVGPSGAGKSTIFDLIARMYEVEKGEIFIGSNSIYDINLRELRKNIGYVTQDNSIMSGSIMDNLLYGNDKDIPMEYIKKVSTLTSSHNFISNFSDGYKTMVGENGIILSGGQKQRLDITRNFIRNPKILLLDEATSSLDSQSEQIIQHALDVLMKNKTTLIIAHRLSTIKNADKIIFLDSGRITGIGTHIELLNTHAKYKEFVFNQNIY